MSVHEHFILSSHLLLTLFLNKVSNAVSLHLLSLHKASLDIEDTAALTFLLLKLESLLLKLSNGLVCCKLVSCMLLLLFHVLVGKLWAHYACGPVSAWNVICWAIFTGFICIHLLICCASLIVNT